MTEAISSRNILPGASPRLDRGWLIVGACFCLTLTLGETFWTFGVFFKPLQQEFGWTRAAVSSIFTAFLLGYAISVIASGRLIDRYNPKPVLLGSALLIVSGAADSMARCGLGRGHGGNGYGCGGGLCGAVLVDADGDGYCDGTGIPFVDADGDGIHDGPGGGCQGFCGTDGGF